MHEMTRLANLRGEPPALAKIQQIGPTQTNLLRFASMFV